MFSKTISYEDFNGAKTSKVFYFHLSKADLIRMAASGSMEDRLKRIIASKDNESIFREFEELIRASVGTRSEDGQTFIKDAAAQANLINSPAYDELLVELVSNADAAVEFITNLIPEKMQGELKAQLNAMKVETVEIPDPFKEPEDPRPAWEREHRFPTDEEVRNMDKEELVRAMRFRTNNP